MSPRPSTGTRTAYQLGKLIQPASTFRKPGKKTNRQLKPYYPAVIAYVYASRFAIRQNIQRRFPEHLSADRTAALRLAHLVELGYLGIASVRSTNPNFPHVYYAKRRGLAWLEKRLADEKGVELHLTRADEGKQRVRSLDSLLHELLLTEFQLGVYQTVHGREDLTLHTAERRYYRKENLLRFREQGQNRTIRPDAGFLLSISARQGTQPSRLQFYVELDAGTMAPRKILEKYQHYHAWSRTDGVPYLTSLYGRLGDQNPKPNFRLLMIAHDKYRGLHKDERRMLDLIVQALDPSIPQNNVWFTTVSQLNAHAGDPLPLQAAIWYRIRDFKPYLNQFRSNVAGGMDKGQQPNHARRQFVEMLLPNLPRYPLFPPSS